MLPSGLLGLLALILWMFWKYVGGGGGFFPGSGPGSESRDAAESRRMGISASARDSTVRRFVSPPTASLASRPFTAPPATARVTPLPGGSGDLEVRVTLGPGRTASPSTRVEVLPSSGPPPAPMPLVDGRATVGGIKSGEHVRVRVIQDGEPLLAGEGRIDGGEIVLDLEERARIVGRASFADEPAGGRDLEARIYRAGHEREVVTFRTGPQGEIDLDAPAGSDVLLELRPKEAVAGADFAAVVFHRDALAARETWDLGPNPVGFEREVVLADGVVEDAEGKPVRDVTVLVLPLRLPTRALWARTDDSGRFVVKGPPAADAFEVFASTETHATRLEAPAQKGATGLKLVLAPAGSIRGSVASPAAVLNAVLRVELLTERDNPFLTTQVRDDGSFELASVPPGRWTIAVRAPDGLGEPVKGFEVPAGGPSPDSRLSAIPVRTRLSAATLRVMDASGAAVPGAHVELLLDPSAPLRTVTDASGTAAVVAPAGIAVDVTVEARGFTTRRGPWDGKSVIVIEPAREGAASSRASGR